MTKSLLAAAALIAGVFAAPAASAQDVIRIGAPLPITGPLSPEAQKQQRGYDLWAETANKAGGVNVGAKRMKVEIVYVDYQSNTPRAVQAAEKLITQDKVDFLFSPFGSGATKAALQRLREVRRADDRRDRVVGAGLRPGLQVPVRHVHAQRHAHRTARRHRAQAGRRRAARRHPRAQRPLPARHRARRWKSPPRSAA